MQQLNLTTNKISIDEKTTDFAKKNFEKSLNYSPPPRQSISTLTKKIKIAALTQPLIYQAYSTMPRQSRILFTPASNTYKKNCYGS